MPTPRLELLYANQDALISVLGVPAHEQARYLDSDTSLRERATKQQALTTRLEERLEELAPSELQRVVLSGSQSVGQLVALEQAFYFKRDRRTGTITMRAKLNTDESVEVSAVLDSSRFPFASTSEHLSRRNHVFVIGSISRIDGSKVALRPAFIGWRTWGPSRQGLSGGDWASRRIHPQSVDQFANVDWSAHLTAAETRVMESMRESDIKERLAEILGFPFVEMDWGGERSDMLTNNLLVDGVQCSSSWLLKGRSVQRKMQIADLGANGDQIERLTTDASDVIVVQHNRAITAAVVNMAAAFAYDMRNPRRYMILDGMATAMVLRDYGHLR